MIRKSTVLTFALGTLVALPAWAAPPSGAGHCTDVPLLLVVAPQTSGQGGISGDGVAIYNNPNDPAFNGGTEYQDGVGGVYVKFQVCNGTNDFHREPARHLARALSESGFLRAIGLAQYRRWRSGPDRSANPSAGRTDQ